jgi:hypothetical protein
VSEPERLGGTLWEYVPKDRSRERLLAIIGHPAVARTDGIDRQGVRISPRAPQTARRGGLFIAPQAARATKAAGYLCLLAAAVLLAIAARGAVKRHRPWRFVDRAARALFAAVARGGAGALGFLSRGVPQASPESAAAFRVVFGALSLWFALIHPAVDVAIRSVDVEAAVGLQRAVGVRLLGDPSLAAWIDRAVLVFGLLFVAGVRTRLTSLGYSVAYLVWACVFTLNVSHHQVSALVASLLCLAGSRAGDAWSVDAWLRRGQQAPPVSASPSYGFVTWVPGFVLGVAFLAAAWSKVSDGPQWILNGTVRYHFVTDLDAALVKWGPVLAASRPNAIAMSAAAVAVETAVIAASFVRGVVTRLLLGALAAALLTGFALFQGIVWPAWWMLLLSFLPWPLVQRSPVTGERRLPAPYRAVIVAVLVLQLVASVRSLEVRPFLSAYDMYSATYASPEEYEEKGNLKYRVVIGGADGREFELPDCVLNETAARRIAPIDSEPQLSHVLSDHGCAEPGGTSTVTLLGDRRVFDFDTRQFFWRRAVRTIGPIRVK